MVLIQVRISGTVFLKKIGYKSLQETDKNDKRFGKQDLWEKGKSMGYSFQAEGGWGER